MTLEARKRERYYLTNEEFLEELKRYRETKIISDRLGEMFQKLSRKIANKPNFYNYTYREDMINEGVLTCITYIDNFDPNVSKNPFSYFTQIIFNAFIGWINREKKQSRIKEQIRESINEGHKRETPKRIKYHEEMYE